MSATISIVGVYRNGSRVNRGLHNSVNYAVITKFEVDQLVEKFVDAVGSKALNTSPVVWLNKSNGFSGDSKEIRIRIPLKDLYKHTLFISTFFEV